MDFQFSEAQEKFRQEVREFLEEETPADWTAVEFIAMQELETDEQWAFCVSVRRKMAARGWLSLWWPRRYGGRESSRIDYTILREEVFYRGAVGFDGIGCILLAPVMLVYGTEEQKQEHLSRIARGQVQWCQGFSEPNAGSDLASLTMRAREDGDYFVLDGQKCWTSMSYRADWGFFLVRTDPDAAKHRGLSLFVVDMKTPGITLRPVYNLAGKRHWDEVFFDGVRVPAKNLVGGKNQGWRVATSVLNSERVGIEQHAICRRALDRLLRYVRQNEALAKDPVVRQRLADLATEVEVCRLFCYRTAWMQDRGLEPVHEASVGKAFADDLLVHIANASVDILGLYGQLERGSKWAPLGGAIAATFLTYPPWTVGSGSQEVQKNIIATVGLQLPR
jgi:alkylation response protein AidB-like acyl-CoA dehydrogenase